MTMPYLVCDAFVGCTRVATMTVVHPTMGRIPACSPCAANLDLVGLAGAPRPLPLSQAQQLAREASPHRQLVVDLADGDGYGVVHAEGCRQARDPEPIPDGVDPAEHLGWDPPMLVAPCATRRDRQ